MTLRFRRFLENPVVARQLATSLGAGKLAWVFLLMNTTAILSVSAGFVFVWEQDFFRGVGLPNTGRALHIFLVLALQGALTILLPLRVAGLLDASRVGQTFDQLVVTGISPFRLHLAHWALGVVYAFFLLLVTLPVVCICQLLGGLTVATIAATYGVLFLYANVILLVTLALSILEREWLTVPLLVVGLLIAEGIAITPDRDALEILPPVFSELLPSRALIRLVDPFSALGFRDREIAYFHEVPRLFGADLSLEIYPYVGWCAIALVAMAFLIVGPLFGFQPGLNTFGVVSRDRARKRRRKRALRLPSWVLVRRGELAFLYENRPAWCRDWEAPLRFGSELAVFVFLLAALYGLTPFDRLSANLTGVRGAHGTWDFTGLSSLLLGMWVLLRMDSRRRMLHSHGLGRRRIPRHVFQLALGGTLVAIVLLANAAGLRETLAAIQNATSADLADAVAASVNSAARIVIGSGLLFVFTLFLVGRVLSWMCATAATGRLFLLAVAFTFFVLSALLEEGIRHDAVPDVFGILAYFSPISPLQDVGRRSAQLGETWSRFLLSHAVVIAFCVGAMWVLARRARKRDPMAARPVQTAGLALCLLFATTASAQNSRPNTEEEAPLPLTILEVHRGFGGNHTGSDRDFFTVIVDNPTAEDVNGTYWLEYDGTRGRSRSFSIGRGTKQILRWNDLFQETHEVLIYSQSDLVLEAEDGRRVRAVVPALVNLNTGTVAFTDEGRPPVAWRQARAANPGNATLPLLQARTVSLPDAVSTYMGTERVVIRSPDPRRWTPSQSRALFDYARLGGSVVFCGTVDLSLFPEPWSTPFSTWSTTDGELAGGTVAKLPLGGDDESTPALNWLRIGPGTICLSSVDLVEPQLSEGRPLPGEFWDALESTLPRSAFPCTVAADPWEIRHDLEDLRSLFAMFAFLIAYGLCLPLALVLCFRAKRRRPWRWAATIVLAIGASMAVPWVLRGVTRSASSAAFCEVDYYSLEDGNVSSGVALGAFTLVSAGRQDHTLNVAGSNVTGMRLGSAFLGYRHPSGSMSSLLPLQRPAGTPEDPDLPDTFAVRTSLWGLSRGLLLGDAPRRVAPGSARAVYDVQRDSLRLEAPPEIRQLGEPISRTLRLAAYNLPRGEKSAAPVYARGFAWPEDSGEPVAFEQDLPEDSRGPQVEYSPLWQSYQRVGLPRSPHKISCRPGQPRVLLLWSVAPEGSALRLHSDDVRFERKLSDKAARRLREAGRNSSTVIERDGDLYRSLRRRVIALEIPVEIVDAP